MNPVLMLVAFGVVLIPLIIIHEFGHLLACKSVGISVLEFGIGFPPRLARLFRWGETEFTINAVPLGGFVMPYGEDFLKPSGDNEMGEMETRLRERGVTQPKSVFQATPLQKIWFLAAGPLANFVAAFVLFIIVPLTGLPTLDADVAVAEVLPGTTAASRALRPMGNENVPPDYIIAVNGETFHNSAELEAIVQAFVDENPGAPVTFTIRRDDPVTGEQIFDTEMTPNLEVDAPEERVRILAVQPETPAQRAGFHEQDIVVSAAGEDINDLAQLQRITKDNEGIEILVVVERGGELLELSVTPEQLDGEGSPARIGIEINILYVAPFGFVVDDINGETVLVRHSIVESFEYGVESVGTAFQLIASLPGKIVRGEISGQEARPVSPVGVSQIGAEIIEDNPNPVPDMLLFAAIISIALGLSNLLPIPALDGGRILFVIVEIIRGKPMTPEREGLVHLVGFVLMFALLIVLVINDLANPLQLPQ